MNLISQIRNVTLVSIVVHAAVFEAARIRTGEPRPSTGVYNSAYPGLKMEIPATRNGLSLPTRELAAGGAPEFWWVGEPILAAGHGWA